MLSVCFGVSLTLLLIITLVWHFFPLTLAFCYSSTKKRKVSFSNRYQEQQWCTRMTSPPLFLKSRESRVKKGDTTVISTSFAGVPLTYACQVERYCVSLSYPLPSSHWILSCSVSSLFETHLDTSVSLSIPWFSRCHLMQSLLLEHHQSLSVSPLVSNTFYHKFLKKKLKPEKSK